MPALPDILLIDKPANMSSFGVIRLLRKKTGIKKMGHAGTLDPLASGLMIIGINDGTKKLSKLIKMPKTYDAEIFLGVSTETYDLEGKVVDVQSVTDINEDSLRDVVEGMEGDLKLEVPIYSAVKVNGTPLYKYARAGIPITPPTRIMNVLSANIFGGTTQEIFCIVNDRVCLEDIKKEVPHGFGFTFKVRFNVASGVYIRSLVNEIGKRFGVPATLFSLRRTSIGDFKLEEALALDEI